MRRTLVSAVAAAAVTASLFAATPAQAAEVDIKGSGSSFAGNFLIDCASRYTAKTGNKVSYTATSSGKVAHHLQPELMILQDPIHFMVQLKQLQVLTQPSQ